MSSNIILNMSILHLYNYVDFSLTPHINNDNKRPFVVVITTGTVVDADKSYKETKKAITNPSRGNSS